MQIFPEFAEGFPFIIILRLIVAAILGGVIGFERSGNRHEAGLRTHIIVCLGAAAVMVVGELVSLRYGGDATRMSAQVISGIGFLGAGSIMMSGGHIKGITTAAGIWTTACIGLVVGAGYYIIAICIVVIMMIAMLGLRSFAKKLEGYSQAYALKIELVDRDSVEDVLAVLQKEKAIIKSVRIKEDDGLCAKIEFELPHTGDYNRVLIDISRMEKVSSTTSYSN